MGDFAMNSPDDGSGWEGTSVARVQEIRPPPLFRLTSPSLPS
jgi:hypothetical protein